MKEIIVVFIVICVCALGLMCPPLLIIAIPFLYYFLKNMN